MVYDNLTPYEKSLANFGDRAAIIAGLEISDKISEEEAYQQIRELYKNLKHLRKVERKDWNSQVQ
jgi:hypothetical protein